MKKIISYIELMEFINFSSNKSKKLKAYKTTREGK